MKMANLRLFLLVCILFAVFSYPVEAFSYSAADVKGNYSFLLNRWTTTTADNVGLLGILTFNGVNSVTGSFNEMTTTGLKEGTVESGSSYTVESGGSGSATLVTTDGSITLDFVLTSVSNSVAQELQLLATEPSGNWVTAGTAIAINLSGSATAANLKGTYSFLGNYWTAESSASQKGLIGTATFDGVSKVTLSYTRDVDGVTTPRELSGTYAVSPNGSGTLTFTVAGADFTSVDFVLNSVVSSIATSAQFLIIKPADEVGNGTAILQ